MQGGGPQGGGGGGICHNFQNGSCKYGANCRFVHPGQATAGPSGGGFQGRGGGGGNQNFGGGGGGFNKGGFGGSFGGGGGNRYGGGGGNQQQGGGGNRFNNQNQGQGGGGGNQFGNQRRHGPRVNSNTLCNFFLQGKCTRGNTCQNIHQYSVDYDIQGEEFADLKKIYSTNKINVISMDIYEVSLENNQIAVILCTLSQLALVLLPSGQKVDLPVPEGNLTAFHYDRNNKLIFLGYLSTKSNKGGIKIYKDNGGGEFQEIANAPDLHPKEIMGIQTQIVMDNMLLLTAGKDDHLKAWVIQNDGKFELIASGIATDPIYNIICANDCIFAGCGSGKVEVFRLSGNAKEFERFKEFDVHSDSNSIITRVIGTEDCIYAASYCGGNNGSVGQVGFISCTNPEKISHLVSLPLPAGAITLEHMPIADIIFIGYDNGTLEFRDKDGFIEKGKAFIHKNPIRDIKQINDLFLVVDETGLFTLWKILDEKTAEQKKQEYKQQQQQQGFGGGFGGNSFSGGFGGGGSFNQGGGGGFNTGGFGGGGGNMFSGGNNTMGDGFGMSGGGQMGNF